MAFLRVGQSELLHFWFQPGARPDCWACYCLFPHGHRETYVCEREPWWAAWGQSNSCRGLIGLTQEDLSFRREVESWIGTFLNAFLHLQMKDCKGSHLLSLFPLYLTWIQCFPPLFCGSMTCSSVRSSRFRGMNISAAVSGWMCLRPLYCKCNTFSVG